MSIIDAIRDHVSEHREGMLFDLVFAIAWVTLVSLIFEVVDGPRWAYYLLMFAGVVAYFGFVTSWEVAKQRQG